MSRSLFHDIAVADTEHGRLLEHHSVLVEGGRIARVASAAELADLVPSEVAARLQGSEVPASATELRSAGDLTVIDGRGHYLVPGLMDLHVHLVWGGEEDPQAHVDTQHHDDTLLKAYRRALDHLHSGITTVRDLGSVDDMAISVADAIDGGDLDGPTVFAAGRTIIMTGGHDPFWGNMADGVTGVTRAVRQQVYRGARVIKVSATGGVYGRATGEKVGQSELSRQELTAIADEAHRFGLRVAAHAIGREGIENAIEAGIDTIEHGQFLTRELVERMAEKGTGYVPTLFVYQHLATSPDVPAYTREKARGVCERHLEAVALAREYGITMGAGSDAGSPGTRRHPLLFHELRALESAGIPPLEVLDMATRQAGRLLGDDALGRLSEGCQADLVVTRADPGRKLIAPADMELVYRRGEKVTGRRAPA